MNRFDLLATPAPALLAAALSAAVLATACTSVMQHVPPAIAAPSDQHLVLTVGAKGTQIYECRADAAGGTHRWTFVAPDAELFGRDGRRIGTHGAGPHWTFDDGLRITARVKARSDAPLSGAIPWLLLEAEASSAPPRVGRVQSIQRIRTTGGIAPASGCDAASAGRVVHVPYTADYLFYGVRV